MTITTNTPVDNGVNVEALLGARDALTDAPEAAQFKWRATLHVGQRHPQPLRPSRASPASARSSSTARPSRSTPTTRECFASEDNGATPVEFVLVGAGRLPDRRRRRRRPVAAASSSARSPPPSKADMNVLGILGADPDVRNGFSGITVDLRHRRRRLPRRHRGARRPVAEALGGVRHRDQPDQRHRRAR